MKTGRQYMKISTEGMSLRVFIGETDIYKGKTIYEHIVLKAKELNLSGVTVTRGILGFGFDKRMHSAKLLRLSENLPIIIEIIDSEENINKIIPFLDEIIKEGLVTLEHVKVLQYR